MLNVWRDGLRAFVLAAMMGVPAGTAAQDSIVLDDEGGRAVVTTGNKIVHLLDGSNTLAVPAFSATNRFSVVLPLESGRGSKMTAPEQGMREGASNDRQTPSAPFQNFMRGAER